MRNLEDMIPALMAKLTAGQKSLFRDILAEFDRVRRERDAAREALRLDPAAAADGLRVVMTPTGQLTDIDGVPVRMWQGRTDRGVRCLVFVHRVAVDDASDCSEFDSELRGVSEPRKPIDYRAIAPEGGGS
jgi:hypothetical protein